MTKRLGFFTRLLDETNAAERYRLATAQIVQAERSGFDSAWIAQHHFHEAEGGLPAPFVFLAHVAASTSRIRLGTGIVTLPLDERAAFRAGQAHAAYRRAGGERQAILADFLIAGHASVLDAALVTRDRQRFASYFPELRLIAPETHNG